MGGTENTIRLLDAATTKEIGLFEGHPTNANALAFSPDRVCMAVASGDWQTPGEITLWDLVEKKRRTPLQDSEGVFSSVAFSSDGARLAAGAGREVKVWDIRTGRLYRTLTGHVGDVISLAFAPDGKSLAAGTYEDRRYEPELLGDEQVVMERITPAELRLWDVATAQVRMTKKGRRISCVAFSPDGSILASGIWNELTGFSGGWLRSGTSPLARS
jgi:WD40 repeat protein